MDIRLGQAHAHLRVAQIQPDVWLLLPTPDGTPLVVEGSLRVVTHPERFGPHQSLADWRRWVDSYAVTRYLNDRDQYGPGP